VTALALGPCMDRDGGAAISDGVLHLTVGRALYETLGLTGRNNPADTGKWISCSCVKKPMQLERTLTVPGLL
jgi:hypothetical protein